MEKAIILVLGIIIVPYALGVERSPPSVHTYCMQVGNEHYVVQLNEWKLFLNYAGLHLFKLSTSV